MWDWQLFEQEESPGLLAAGIVQAHEIDAGFADSAALAEFKVISGD